MPRPPSSPRNRKEPKLATSQAELSKLIGVSEATLKRIIAHEDGWPELLHGDKYDVDGWRLFLKDRKKRQSVDAAPEGEDGPDESKALKIAKTREEVRKLKLANDEKEKVLVPGEEWEMALSQMLVMFNTTLDTLPERLASMLTGRMDHADKVAIIFKEVEALKEVLRGTNKYLVKPA